MYLNRLASATSYAFSRAAQRCLLVHLGQSQRLQAHPSPSPSCLPTPLLSPRTMVSPPPPTSAALPELEPLLRLSSKRTHSLYLSSSSFSLPHDSVSHQAALRSKIVSEYADAVVLPPSLAGAATKRARTADPAKSSRLMIEGGSSGERNGRSAEAKGPSQELVSYRHAQGLDSNGGVNQSRLSKELMKRKEAREVVPEYHPQCAFSVPHPSHSPCMWPILAPRRAGLFLLSRVFAGLEAD